MKKKINIYPTLDRNLAKVLREHGIKEKDLFHYQGDLHVGFKTFGQALIVKNKGAWKSMSKIFRPNKESDMGDYEIGLEIGLGALDYNYMVKRKNRENSTKK